VSATILAASAGGVVEQVGSYAGYASIVGLGILSLLYFTQAREVKRLREWAGRAPERAAELEERVQADAQKRVVAQPLAPTSAAAQQAADARAQAATAAVYASIGAPPPGAPAPAPGAPPPPGQLARPVPPPAVPAPGAVPSAPAPGTLPVAPAPAAAAGTQTPTPSPTGRPMVTATPTPGAAAPPAAATAAARVAAASRTVPAPANGSTSQDTAESAAARPEPLPAPPSLPPSQSDADEDTGGGFGVSPARVGMIVGGAVATILVAAVLMVVLTGGNEDNKPPENSFGNTPSVEQAPSGSSSAAGASGSGSGSSSSSSALTSAERRATDIAVLNGTTQTGLARAVSNKIQDDGYTIAAVDTNSDQSVPTTIVSYTGDNEQAALAVAKIIGIDRGSVQAADANTAAAATADVIVIVGSDQIE
jgi:hypothetical protein